MVNLDGLPGDDAGGPLLDELLLSVGTEAVPQRPILQQQYYLVGKGFNVAWRYQKTGAPIVDLRRQPADGGCHNRFAKVYASGMTPL